MILIKNKHHNKIELRHEISNNVVCATSKAPDQAAHTRSLIRAFASCLNILSAKLLAEQHLEFLSLTGSFTGSSESILVKMPHCWKSHVPALNVSWQNIFSVEITFFQWKWKNKVLKHVLFTTICYM